MSSWLQSSLLHVHAVVNHACEHVNIPEYMKHFRTYTDFGNQGVTNTGENVRYIHVHTYIHTRAVVMINVGLAQAHPNNF